MQTCQVSRNTIFTDLQAVISQLYTYQLELRYEKKTGYWIQGDPTVSELFSSFILICWNRCFLPDI